MPPSVLFVCLGNICRSPLAEGALRAACARSGLDMRIDSAGTGNWHAGDPPDPRACAVAKAHGVDITKLRARQVTKSDFSTFTHIIALDKRNLADLRQLQPVGSTAKLSLLLDHVAGRTGQSVADPYYGGPEDFERAWQDVSTGAEALLAGL